MKKLLIFAFLVFILLLHAENPQEDQLDLGDILIIGETTALSDTVSGERDLAQYWYVSEPQQFEFKAFFSFPEIQLPEPFALRNNLAIKIIGGNYYFGNFKGVYSSGNYLRFASNYYCRKIEEDWKDTKCSFTWQPAFNNHDFNLQLLQDKYESESGDTKIEGINLKYDNNFISIRNFDSLILDLDVKLCYNEFSQLDASAKDFDFLSYTKMKYENYLGEIEINLLKQSLSGNISGKVTNLLFFKQFGFWLGVDKEHIYPSIEFSTEFNPFPKLYLLLDNKPEIEKVSRKDAFQQNNYQWIIMDKLQTKKPLNGNISLKYNCFIPFTLFYNISWNQNYKIYYSTDSFYKQTNVDVISQKFGLRGCYKFKFFEISQDVFYNQRSEEIAFSPIWEGVTCLCFERDSWKAESQVEFINGRKDENNRDMKDTLLINLMMNYAFRKNLTLIAEVENLLGQKYSKYPEMPVEVLQVKLGIKVVF